jgi:hypothetical protein
MSWQGPSVISRIGVTRCAPTLITTSPPPVHAQLTIRDQYWYEVSGHTATVLLGAALDALIENVVVVNEKVSEEFAKSGLSSKRRARV